ncbi:MAG TPA: M23 family metallopeptidase [Gaiellaceae bacterium]|nr:M23 family metallopeptidase [Gaiellaceae bacterium]
MRRRAAILLALLCVLAWPAAALAHPDGTPRPHRHLTHALVFRWPALGAITTRFSSRHDGIDIGSLRSLSIRAAYPGRVLHVGYTSGFEGYGNIVDVEIAPGVETLYAHLSAEAVHVGQHVRRGQRLGTAGCTGLCYGTHLHFEVREHGIPVNPLRFLH